EALDALADGQPRFLVLAGEGGTLLGQREGVREYAMTCHSGGALEIYVEPVLPRPAPRLLGAGAVAAAPPPLGTAARVAAPGVAPRPAAPADVVADHWVDDLDRAPVTAATAIVVATHGQSDEDALERALSSDAEYVSLVASPKRARVVTDSLRARGLPEERLGRLRAPAGLDLGA